MWKEGNWNNKSPDAAVYEQPVLKNIVARNDGLTVLPELLVDDQYGFVVRLQDTLLKKAMDDVLSEMAKL
jgi:polar amino acid transport system substrate-binding protein